MKRRFDTGRRDGRCQIGQLINQRGDGPQDRACRRREGRCMVTAKLLEPVEGFGEGLGLSREPVWGGHLGFDHCRFIHQLQQDLTVSF